MAKPRSTEAPTGFEFCSPWLPAAKWEGWYILALSAKHARMWRWRFFRRHDREPDGKPFVVWVLDESSAPVDPAPTAALLPTVQTFDEPRRLVYPRDKGEATAVVVKRWADIRAEPVAKADE